MYKFDNSDIRRQDRLLCKDKALELLHGGEYGFLALGGGEGGYGIPMSYACEGEYIYFHCAPEGRKLRLLESDSRASFCVVGRTEVQSASFSTEYESILAFGNIETVSDDHERMHALELILRKYSPQFMDTGMIYSAKSSHRTVLLRLTIKMISAKGKSMNLPCKPHDDGQKA